MTVHKHDLTRTFRRLLAGSIVAFSATMLAAGVSAQSPAETAAPDPVAGAAPAEASAETSGETAGEAAGEAACWAGSEADGNPSANANGYVLGIGDLLRISLYQRPDLSGEFRVREDGRISLPLLGLIPVAGKDLVETEKAIHASFQAIAGLTTSLGLEVVERRPFYVIGLVNAQGPHPYTRGLTVLRAVALSGGLFRPGLNLGPSIDVSREAARLGAADAELKRNLARHVRLLAEREGKETIEAPEKLVELESPDRVQELMAAERRLMRERNIAYQKETEGRKAGVRLAKEVISSLEEQHKAMLQQVELARKEQAISEDLLKKGLSRRGDLLTLQRVMANLEAGERDTVARIARAKFDLVTAERDLSLLEVNRSLNLEQEINTVEAQIASNELSIRYSKRIIESLTSIPVNNSSSIRSSTMKYDIVRNMGKKQKILEATESTPLCPDDVLRVMPSPED
ncbi:MAG: polysaccharide biosynthesis/export family protein [Hyphomicrobiales bacterium]|nr:polysaccharide biosynthesis/export family protein [Hyphomicrobiales bacterium]